MALFGDLRALLQFVEAWYLAGASATFRVLLLGLSSMFRIASVRFPLVRKACSIPSFLQKCSNAPDWYGLPAFELIVRGTPNVQIICSHANFSISLPLTAFKSLVSIHLVDSSIAVTWILCFGDIVSCSVVTCISHRLKGHTLLMVAAPFAHSL